MPFGLSGAPGSFQRLMDTLFHDFSFVTTYLDDVLVHSRTVAEHKEHLRAVFDKLESAELTLNGSKCTIGINQVKYLGHVFSFNGIEPDPSKTSAGLHPQIQATSTASWDWRIIIAITYTTLLK